jgi:excinuclease ABC subunit B
MSPLGLTERGNSTRGANNPSLSATPTSLPQGERSSGATPAEPSTYFRYNSLDEMTVGRTEEPVTGIKPVKRAKIGLGSDEDKGEQRRAGKRTGKTGRPGR